MTWSTEAIIALVTLLVTCAPLGILLWRLDKRKSQQIADHGMQYRPNYVPDYA